MAVLSTLSLVTLLSTLASALPVKPRDTSYKHTPLIPKPSEPLEYYVSFGPRPYYIVQNMTAGPLRDKLESCANGPFGINDWSIGHRGGGTLQIPEESVQSIQAGARMGAGVLECDVAFTQDRGLVCRHSLCDLHTTTDILLRPELAAKCTVPFTPANDTADANALCCTTDITTAEYTSLCSKMDGFNASATNVEDFQHGAPSWRTELYDTCGTVMTLESHIDLVNSLPGYRNFTPELKTPPAQVPMPFNGYTQAQFASDMIETFIRKGIAPSRVWAQSFLPDDIFQWIDQYPEFGSQAVYLDEDGDTPETFVTAVARLPDLKARGVNIVSPPIPYLLTYGDDTNSTFVPSSYATTAKAAGLDIIAWSFERSGPLTDVNANEDYYYATFSQALSFDGQAYEILDVLANEIGVVGMFSDWSATTSYFANCFDLKGPVGGSYFAGSSDSAPAEPAEPAKSTTSAAPAQPVESGKNGKWTNW